MYNHCTWELPIFNITSAYYNYTKINRTTDISKVKTNNKQIT
jgi:hypothetical protein